MVKTAKKPTTRAGKAKGGMTAAEPQKETTQVELNPLDTGMHYND
jgi:hypothetical protein